jgi:polyhydroxybutyrate depolymerase
MLILLTVALLGADPLTPGDHTRKLQVDGRERTYLVHVPPNHDPEKPVPVVLVFHGAAMNAPMMVQFSGMSEKADAAGFIAVYPNGTGLGTGGVFNCGGWQGMLGQTAADDVKFTRLLLDDLETVVRVNPKRVYATGLSNGGMMCYRLAAELADRIAAIAPVAGTLAIDDPHPERPISVLHFHGTEDSLVPFDGLRKRRSELLKFKSVPDTIAAWRKLDNCPDEPQITALPDKADDGTTVEQKTWGPCEAGSEVILVEIKGGGHTWPGRKPPVPFIGRSTGDISACDMIWEFFEKHPMK